MTTHGKGIFGSVTATVVVVVAYIYSYGYFDEHHSHIRFPSAEYALWVPDIPANHFFAVFYAPISFAIQTPFRYEPEPTPRPRPNHALQRTEAGGASSLHP